METDVVTEGAAVVVSEMTTEAVTEVAGAVETEVVTEDKQP